MRAPTSRRSKRLGLAFLALAFVVMTGVSPYLPALNNPNENVRIYMTMAIVEEGTFRIDEIVQRHGYVNDMARAPDENGEMHLYSLKGPGVSYFGVPVYYALTKVMEVLGEPLPDETSDPVARADWYERTVFVLRLFVLQIPAWLFVVWLERAWRPFCADDVIRRTAIFAGAFGTNFLGYSQMFVSHSVFAMCSFAAFMLVVREWRASRSDVRARRARIAGLAGLFAGLATLSEYQAFPVSCVIAIFALAVFRRPLAWLAFLAGAGVCAGLLMFFQWKAFGNPLTPGHIYAENPQFAAWHNTGFYGLTEPSLEILGEMTTSPTFGLLTTSPYLAAGLFASIWGGLWARGSLSLRRLRRASTWVWILAMGALIVPMSSAVNWRGGWTLGPRFFTGASFFFAYGGMTALDAFGGTRPWRRAFARGVGGGLALSGALLLGLTALVFNTYPESTTRPLVQVALPLAKLGFVPHHIGELIGLDGVATWYFIVCLFFVMAALAIAPRARAKLGPYMARLVTVPAVCAITLVVPTTGTTEAEERVAGADLAFFARAWQPAGRDFVSETRVEAERRGPRGPCHWHRLARMERMLHWELEANRDEARATQPASACPPGWLGY